jgi:hypothetical protein
MMNLACAAQVQIGKDQYLIHVSSAAPLIRSDPSGLPNGSARTATVP